MINFNNSTYETSNIPMLGMAKDIQNAVEAMIEGDALAFGSPVELTKGSGIFNQKANKSVAGVDGVLSLSYLYDENGLAPVGKGQLIVIRGCVCVPLESDSLDVTFGEKIYVTAQGKYTKTEPSNFYVGKVAGNVIKAMPNSGIDANKTQLVDAVFINIGA